MEYLQSYHCLLCYLLLALRDPALCAKEITVSPAKPLVKVGDAVTLICETTCPQGRPRWMELDESDVPQNTTKNRSYLHIAAVHPNHEGKYTCTAVKCRKQKKETIQLRVYSFPVPVLSTVPENPVSGQPFKVKCTLTKVYHRDDDNVEMRLFHLDKLETEHSKNCDGDRFCDHTWSSRNQMGTSKTDYQCETNLTIGPNSFTEKARLTIHFQGDAGDDYNIPRSTATSPEQMETQTSKPVSTEGKGQGDAGDDYNIPRSTATSPEQMETQTSKPVSTEGKGQGDAGDDYNDPRSTATSSEQMETQTSEPVSTEVKGQGDAGDDYNDPRTTATSPEQMETQMSEPVSTEGKGQGDAGDDYNIPRSTATSPEQMETQTSEPVSTEGKGQAVEASSSTTTAMVALGSTVGSLSILCFLGSLTHLIKQRKRKSPPSGPENHPDGC
ncbi:uncharacterized protein LOC120055083 isoform X3 [Salvelinus namaycush]|uniref:Uncharacterized protein LOC120055083 isoform X3 n=1 Tax=Salvelinus namaycush TaxID=8040 RepID=A0A8U1EMM8_SALNM|nr:uncharacterized protein LOC120055083 isoform X3 [Salvelinus namaycush]